MRLDWHRPEIGRIRRNVASAEEATLLRAILSEYYRSGQWDVLHALRAGRVRMAAVREAWRRGATPSLVPLTVRELLGPWAAGTPNVHTRRIRMRALQRYGHLLPQALPDTLRRERTAGATARGWNILREALLAGLRDTLGREHELYRAVAAVPPLPYRATERQPLRPEELAGLPPAVREVVRALCLTGMRPGEYWGDWAPAGEEALEVRGTKTAAAHRLIPAVPVERPAMSYAAARQAVRRAGLGCLYRARHTYAHLLELAGIPRSRRRRYLGHAGRDVTDTYEAHDVRQYLAADRQALLAAAKTLFPEEL